MSAATEYKCAECYKADFGDKIKAPEYARRTVPKSDIPQLAVFLSGRGSNFGRVVEATQRGEVNALVSGVWSNRADAGGLDIARNAGVPIIDVPTQDWWRERDLGRAAYEESLASNLEELNPDALLLLGYMNLVRRPFLEKMEQLEIPVINLHPALLTEKGAPIIRTTDGTIPVFRGDHGLQDAYSYKPRVRVTGVTIHQILPGKFMDTGPIIFQQEVEGPGMEESFESFAFRVQSAEKPALVNAVGRLAHVFGHNINISRGVFPWIDNYGELPNPEPLQYNTEAKAANI